MSGRERARARVIRETLEQHIEAALAAIHRPETVSQERS